MTADEGSTNLPTTRVSDADRERAHALLKAACVDGRLTLEEFADRVEQVEEARTHDQLLQVTRDLSIAAARAAPPSSSTTSTTAILSSVERTGRWRIGETNRAFVVMGDCKLDLRHAAISAPVTTIEVRVVMGNLDVTVPEGVEVELEATTVMGARTLKWAGAPPSPGGPIVRITGLVVMGALNVRVRGR
jgi:hypothetical protein